MGNLPRPIVPDPSAEPTFRELARHWLDAQEHQVRAQTLDLYTRCLRRICQQLGHITLGGLAPRVALRYALDRAQQSVGPATVARDWYLLKAVTAWAEVMGWGLDPLRALGRCPVRQEEASRNPARPMSLEEWGKFAAVVRADDRRRRVPILPFYALLYGTGLRIGEARQARWSACDFEAAVWTVAADTSKSRRRRAIPLSPALIEELIRLVPIHEKLYRRRIEPQDLVFLSARGLPLKHPHQLVYFDRVLLHAGISKVTEAGRLSPHSLRHGYATNIVQAGGSVDLVAKLLGHASPAVTHSVYVQTGTEHLRSILAALAWDTPLEGSPGPNRIERAKFTRSPDAEPPQPQSETCELEEPDNGGLE